MKCLKTSKRETKKQNNVKTISNNETNEEKESIEQGKKEDERNLEQRRD